MLITLPMTCVMNKTLSMFTHTPTSWFCLTKMKEKRKSNIHTGMQRYWEYSMSTSGSRVLLRLIEWISCKFTGLDKIQTTQVASKSAAFIELVFWTQQPPHRLDSSALVASSELFTSSLHFRLAESLHQIRRQTKTIQIGNFSMFQCNQFYIQMHAY
jgi:hypothetical protein